MTKIRVIGIGGAGGNAVSRMFKFKLKGADLIALNTDIQDLNKTKAHFKLRIGEKTTQGLGSGMDPEIGRKAALESQDKIAQLIKDSDMVFITFGAGGGTGTGAGPVVAEISKNLGILTVAIVTMPFSFEGFLRKKIAEEGLVKLKQKVDSLITISNDKIFEVLDPKTNINSAFLFSDEILRHAVSGISDLVFRPGIINVDFADIKSVLANSGSAIFGIGKCKGENRAIEAAKSALNFPLLNTSFKGAKAVLFNVSGGKDISLSEIEQIASFIGQEINKNARIIFGASYDNSLPAGEIKVTIIATGF
jgi:cell division protein FtsZ